MLSAPGRRALRRAGSAAPRPAPSVAPGQWPAPRGRPGGYGADGAGATGLPGRRAAVVARASSSALPLYVREAPHPPADVAGQVLGPRCVRGVPRPARANRRGRRPRGRAAGLHKRWEGASSACPPTQLKNAAGRPGGWSPGRRPPRPTRPRPPGPPSPPARRPLRRGRARWPPRPARGARPRPACGGHRCARRPSGTCRSFGTARCPRRRRRPRRRSAGAGRPGRGWRNGTAAALSRLRAAVKVC